MPKLTVQERVKKEQALTEISAQRLTRAKNKKYLQYLNKNLKASKDRKTGSRVPDSPEKDFTNTDRKVAMAQARQFCDENPLAFALLLTNLNFVVGGGFKLSIKTDDKELNRKIEKQFRIDSDSFDIRGLRSWDKLLRMWQARKVVDGDLFINPIVSGDNLKIATYEADRCYDVDDQSSCGITFDAKTGAPKAYKFGPYTSDRVDIKKKTFILRAADVIPMFHFPQERSNRSRGVSYYLQLLNLIKDIDENLENMDLKIKNESFLGIIFKRESQGTPLFDSETTDEESERPLVKFKRGLNVELEAGEDAQLLESKNPHGSYVDYIRFRMRMAGLTFGSPLEFVFMDTKETNYSGMQVLGQLFKKALIPQQNDMKKVCSDIFKRWLEATGLYTDDIYYAHSWAAPSVGLLNILTESKALDSLLKSKLISRQDALNYMGASNDFDDMILETSKEQEMMDDLGITYQLADAGAEVANLEVQDDVEKVVDNEDD